MNWVADENVDKQIVDSLRDSGHQVWAVAEQEAGITDDAVLKRALESEAILVTADKDFGELVFRKGQASGGVLLLRLPGLSAASRAALVVSAADRHGAEMRGRFSVLDPAALRIRSI